MTLTQITEKGIKDGEIVNADINASAAIAGSKIAPAFTADGSITKATPQFKINSNDSHMTMGEEVGRYAIWTSDGSAPGGGEVFRLKTESSSSLGLDYTTRLYNRNGSGGGATEVSLGNGQGSIYLSTNTTGNTGGLVRMAILSDGKVGIGTTSSTRRLSVKSAGANATQISLIDNDSTNEVFQVGQQADGDGFVSVKQDDGTTTISLDASGTTFFNGGNVGIGDSTPTKTLTVGTTTPSILLDDQSGRTVELVGGSTSTGPELRTTYSEDLRFGTNSQERMRVDTSGRLLIGTTSAGTSNLVVKGTTNAWGGAGNATSSVGAKLVLEDDQGRQAAFWAPKGADAAVGTITNHHFFIATGNVGHTFFNQTTGDIEISDGNLKLASGHGIDFSATADGSNVSGVSSSSELLDDYEEGTFTPILKRLMSNNVTEANFYTQQTRQGNYTRIGDRVWITGRCHWNGGSTGSGTTILTNLPFTINTGGANEIPLNIGYRSGWNYTNINAYGGQNMNRFYINFFDNNGSYPLSPSAASTTGSFYFAAHYELV